jgi:hypothetical protein
MIITIVIKNSRFRNYATGCLNYHPAEYGGKGHSRKGTNLAQTRAQTMHKRLVDPIGPAHDMNFADSST